MNVIVNEEQNTDGELHVEKQTATQSLVQLFDDLSGLLTAWIQSLHIKQFEEKMNAQISADDMHPVIMLMMSFLDRSRQPAYAPNSVHLDWTKNTNHHQTSAGKDIWGNNFKYSDNKAPVLDWATQNAMQQQRVRSINNR